MGYLSRKKLCTKMLIFFSAHDIVYFFQIESVPERNIACRALVHAASVSGNQRPPEEEARQSVGCVGVAWTLWQRLQRLRCVWRIKLIWNLTKANWKGLWIKFKIYSVAMLFGQGKFTFVNYFSVHVSVRP